MEDLSSYSDDQLSEACRMMVISNPNYRPDNCDDFDGDYEEPLGLPEITVKINDDWTTAAVSSEDNFHSVECVDLQSAEDSSYDEDETESEDQYVTDAFLNDIISSVNGESTSSDEDEQVVPSAQTKVCELTITDQKLSPSSIKREEDEKDQEEGENEKEEKKNHVINKEIGSSIKVNEKTENRSNSQPP